MALKVHNSPYRDDGGLRHAVYTGDTINGSVPVDGQVVNVTPHYVFVDSPAEAQKLADAIEVEHAQRGTHPVQQECGVLGPLNDAINDDSVDDAAVARDLGVHDHRAVISNHQAAHKALNKKAGL